MKAKDREIEALVCAAMLFFIGRTVGSAGVAKDVGLHIGIDS